MVDGMAGMTSNLGVGGRGKGPTGAQLFFLPSIQKEEAGRDEPMVHLPVGMDDLPPLLLRNKWR